MSWDPSESLRQMRDAADAFDHPRVAELSDQLLTRLRGDDAPYPGQGAALILELLRRKRYFVLLRQAADAFIQSGLDQPAIRRQYAQALLDQGILAAGVTVLERLIGDTAGGGREHLEARGLLGRAYKQMYVATGPDASQQRRRFMERSMAAYDGVWRESGGLWHGINVAALLLRARQDGTPVAGVQDPETAATAIAGQVLERIAEKGDDADTWDRATAVEACVALGRTEDALGWLDSYLQSPGTEAFQLASMLRQLTEVWRLDADADPGARLIPVLKAELLRRQGGEELLVQPSDIDQRTLRRIDNGHGFEKIFGTERFSSLNWFRNALERCRAVARIEDPDEGGVGTGFLAPGASLHRSLPELVLVTNAHVIHKDDPEALHPDQARVTFRALERVNGQLRVYRVARIVWSSLPHELDTVVAELDGYPPGVAALPVADRRPRLDSDPPPQTFIIGHPSGGEQVMFSIRDNLLLDADDTRVHYRTPTLGGSSGSPVCNSTWELVALHHRGLTHMPKLHGKQGTYPANEGIWIERIRAGLQATLG
jgi:Trypsin-like peptidase domain/Tetratricopeptide Repeats-Sensor